MTFYLFMILLCFALSVFFVSLMLPSLRKRAEQPIYAEGPGWHKKKQGTPTMGGVGFLLAIVVCACAVTPFLWRDGRNTVAISLILNLSYGILNSAVGIFDDLKKIKQKQNEGLTPSQKLFFQFIIAALYLGVRAMLLGIPTTLHFLGYTVNLSFWFYPIMLFVMLGIVNSANLTDGIDGLASSVALAIGTVLFAFCCTHESDTPIIGALLIGATLAFLLFNLNPAKIFMGDSGSLLLGALAVGGCFSLDSPLLILIFGFVYVIEGSSVVIQVICYKLWKKRLFKMAPLHHHLELSGMHENMISYLGLLITLLASGLFFAFQ